MNTFPDRIWTPRVGVLVLAAVTLCGARASHAYPFMIRHDYVSCTSCHADPSGGGMLTRYGRAQSEILLRSHWQKPKPDEEMGEWGQFLFGLVPLPEWLLIGGGVRGMGLLVKPEGAPWVNRFILMQADVQGQVTIGRVRINGSIGYAEEGARQAAITNTEEHNLVSRIYWAGVDLDEDREFLLRAGRMNLPFGLRVPEHTLWVRRSTRTDTNAAQQIGLAFSYNGPRFRGELMGIAGNFQVSPDDYRERGYSGFFEMALGTRAAVGISSLTTHADYDIVLGTSLWRQAHGVFARWAPIVPLVLSAEVDLLVLSQPTDDHVGFATLTQTDWEMWQGLHLIGTLEFYDQTPITTATSVGGWGSLVWFCAPHTEFRFDVIGQSIDSASGRSTVLSLLGQFHIFL